MKYLKLALINIVIAQALQAGTVNIEDRMTSYDFFFQNYESVFGKRDIVRDEDFKRKYQSLKKSDRENVQLAIAKLNNVLSDELIKPIIYWKFIEPNQTKLKQSILYSMFYYLNIYRDYLESPFSKNKLVFLNNLRKVLRNENLIPENLVRECLKDIEEKAINLSQIESPEGLAEAIRKTEYFSPEIYDSITDKLNYSLDPRGFIPGNDVKLISDNKVDLDRIKWFNDRIIFGGKSLDIHAPYISADSDKEAHVSMQEDPIFIKITDMITNAKDTIFIDIFLMGGTLGATIAEHLVNTAKEKIKINPNFKVLVLHDFATHYNMIDEMMPVFEYLRDQIRSDNDLSQSFFLLQANIHRHPPGVPFNVTNLIPKDDVVYEEMQKKSTYYESKIDHSKVIVIDANSDYPEAYFGSKNWSDHSGGYYYDDAIWVKGPAAALVQHSYFLDIEAALTTDPNERKLFHYKDRGFDNSNLLSKRIEILDSFKIKRNIYPIVGEDKIRIAEANVDGKLKNARNIMIDMIINAQNHIYMEQLFLYDSYVVDALIKKKLMNPSVSIKVLMDHNGNFGMNGLPNTIFLKELKSYGIEVRAQKTFGIDLVLEDGTIKKYHQENHRKIMSVDGLVLLGGSSNINPDTLQGSFREFGAQIFSKSEIQKFEKKFIIDWNDHEKVHELDIENFEANIAGKKLSRKLSDLINKIASLLIRSKNDLEKRF